MYWWQIAQVAQLYQHATAAYRDIQVCSEGPTALPAATTRTAWSAAVRPLGPALPAILDMHYQPEPAPQSSARFPTARPAPTFRPALPAKIISASSMEPATQPANQQCPGVLSVMELQVAWSATGATTWPTTHALRPCAMCSTAWSAVLQQLASPAIQGTS